MRFPSLTLLLTVVIAVASSSCKKDKEPLTPTPPAAKGNVTLEFSNMAGNQPLELDTKNYINQNGDTFNVTLFNYYISNIKLLATDNSVYSEKESYHLMKATNPESLRFTMTDVPENAYKSITFTIGVDSTRNVSGAQTGALDPVHGMFWSWNSGYIMTKVEGTSPQSTAGGNMLMYHVGGFSGPNNTIKTKTFNLPVTAQVTNSKTPVITMNADVMEWFKTPSVIDFSSLHTVHMPGAAAKKMADNYEDMFSVSKVEN